MVVCSSTHFIEGCFIFSSLCLTAGRLFTVLTKPDVIEMQFDGLRAIHKLHMRPGCTADVLFCAPEALSVLV